MQAAKEAIAKVTGRHGHTTEVDERVNPHITQETVKPTRHENITEAVDREVHQHHHHTTVQPLEHQEVLPEKHAHNQLPTETKEFHHGNDADTKSRLETEAAKYKDTSRTVDTQHTSAAMPSVQGEHVHHHVHETVQPVIHKETIQPETVHTTKPIHEIHHADAQHHGTSVMPTKLLSEFQGHLGNTASGTTRHEEYEGVPRQYNKAMQVEQTEADRMPGQQGVDGPGSHHTGGTGLTEGEGFRDDGHMLRSGQGGIRGNDVAGTGTGSGLTGERTGLGGRDTTGTGTGLAGDRTGLNDRDTTTGTSGLREPGTGAFNGQGSNTTTDTTGTTGKKPSLMDRINPKVDSNGDGKAGFMK